MRRILIKIHLYLGLAAAVFLVILGLTGAVMAFENEWNGALNPSLLKVRHGASTLPWEQIRQMVEAKQPDWKVQRMYMPSTPGDSTYVRLESRKNNKETAEIYVNQYTGEILGWKLDANQLIWTIHAIHIDLAAGKTGSRIVVASSVILLCLSLSGLILWWPRKIFRFAWNWPFRQVNYDLHRTLGFWASGAMLVFAITGLNLHLQTGGGLFAIMEDTAEPIIMPGHGISADQLLQTAREAVPGAETMRISFWNDGRPVLIQMRFPEDHTPAGRTSVTLDPRTGAVVKVVSSRTAPLWYVALVQWNREIHTGTIFRRPSQAIASLLSLLLSVLAASGTTIWVSRQWSAALGRRRTLARASARNSSPV